MGTTSNIIEPSTIAEGAPIASAAPAPIEPTIEPIIPVTITHESFWAHLETLAAEDIAKLKAWVEAHI